MNPSHLIRDYASQVAGAFAMQMYQRYQYDVLADMMADEYTLYGGLLSLGRLVDTELAPQIREAYGDLEKEIVDSMMGTEPLGTDEGDPVPDPELNWGVSEGGGGWGDP